MPQAWYAQFRPSLPPPGWSIAIVAGVVVAALIALELVRSIAALEAGREPVPAQQAGVGRPAEAPGELYRTVLAARLFGAASGSPASSGGRALPETSLQLTLRGAFAGSRADKGSAIIELQGGVTRSVQVGHSIDRETRLRAVHSDHVVLERNGQLETLYFPQFDRRVPAAALAGAALPGELYPSPAGASDSGTTPIAAGSGSDGSAAPSMNADQRREMIRQRLDELRQRASSNRVIP